MFDTLPDRNYKCWVETLHTSLNFIVHALNHEDHVMVEGVCRKGGRGFPEIAKHEEVRGEDNLRIAVRTVKAVGMDVDGVDETIVATLVHDAKPVYFLSSSCEEISWVKKTRKVWVQEKECFMDLEFLRLSLADNYKAEILISSNDKCKTW